MLKLKSTLMDEASIIRVLKRISYEILEKNRGCDNLCLVGICRRGVSIAEMICKNIENVEGIRLPFGKLDITMYRDDISVISPDPVVSSTDIPFDISGKNIVLVDDVLYTGRTVRAGIDALISIGRPATVQLAVLIDRGHREFPIRADYVGKSIPTSRNELIAVRTYEFDGKCSVELLENVN